MSSSGGRGEYGALEDPTNTETEDETLAAAAARRRRQNNRRVSFPDNEITRVHIFRRDDDYDATPPSDQGKSSDKVGEEEGGIGLLRDSQDSQEFTPRDSGQEEDEDVDGLPGVLFRKVEFPSPGSCTFGSFVSSIDEDNAFGPVDASLIRQGTLSESPDSNDVNREITMDSTAFSLHFQRLLQKNDMGGDLMTPDVYPSQEERTPSLGAHSKSSMSLTSAKIKSPRSASPILDSKSAGKDSNAMSLFGENTRKYEYGRLSPSLEALLFSNHVLGPVLKPENGIVNKISMSGDEASAIKHVENSQNKETSIIGTHEVSGTITPVHIESVTAKSPNEKVPLVRPANIEEDGVVYADTSTVSDIQTPTQPLNDELGIVRSPEGSLWLNSLLNVSQELASEQDYDRSQMKGSISSLAAKRRQLFANVSTPTKPSTTSPLSKLSDSLFEEETARRSASLSSIWKNISRLKRLDSSPTSARKFEASAMTLKLSTPLSSSNKNEALGSLDLLGKPAVSPLKRHLLGDGRSGMNTPMNPAVTNSAVESTRSPSKKIRELIRSPAVTGSSKYSSKETHHTQMQIMANSPQEKRKAQRNLENDSPLSKVPRLQITPIKTVISSELPNDLVIGQEIIGDGRQSEHWKDALAKFSEYAANKFFPLVDKLDLGGVHMLDDMLARIQTARKYELLHSEIQSQSKLSYLRKNSEKRSSDLKLLLNKIAYEKARLLLDRTKHDRLKKAEENLKTILQESHKLSAPCQNSLTSPTKTGPHPRNDDRGQDSAKAQKIALGTIKSLRQENDVMDENIKSLSRSISICCRIKGEVVDCNKVKELANDSLRKRMACRLIRLDFKAWKVCSLDTEFGSHTVTLDYLGLIDQRIMVKANPIPSLTISNKLDSLKIEKNFPNMDASTAFAFIFPTQTREKYARSRSLAPGTQITNMLLLNLLDIIEELQLARLQINNFVDATFHASADGQLLLLLAFISFNKDRNLKLTLDLTCLIRGVYPSEIHPHSLEYIDLEDRRTSLAANVDAAIKELGPGHLRIMRICECVSKTMEDS